MNKKLATIYRITNKINNATYIGQTSLDIHKRFEYHKKAAQGNSKYLIHLAMKEFGVENFIIEKIDETLYRHRYIVEQYYIENELKKNTFCYNVNVKGNDFKQIMSLVTRGSKNGMYNKKGNNAVNGQKVYMMDDNGVIIKEFNTVALALDYIGTKGHTQLNKACRNNIKYKGYFWSKTFKKQ